MEEERKAYRNQVEESAKQIQVLQGMGYPDSARDGYGYPRVQGLKRNESKIAENPQLSWLWFFPRNRHTGLLDNFSLKEIRKGLSQEPIVYTLES